MKKKLAIAFLIGWILGIVVTVELVKRNLTAEDLLPACTAEDGHRDGIPCVWTDPDTGTRYIVDSTEYLD